jgi:hypothetical protein
MSGLRVEFEWLRFPDYEVEKGEPGNDEMFISGTNDKLVAVGAPDTALIVRPLDMFPTLYLDFAKSEPTLSAHKEFARKYGLLTNETEEATYIWTDLVKDIKHFIAMASGKKNWDIRDGCYVPYELDARFKLRFGPTDAGNMDVSIVPHNLYYAMTLQCLSNCAKGAEVRSCKSCGELFEIHGASGRRSNREFCSDKCRFAFNHRSRGKKP